MSLLQQQATKVEKWSVSREVGVTPLVVKSDTVHKVASQITELQEQLKQAKSTSLATVTTKKQEYEQKLHAAMSSNLDVEAKNEQVAKAIRGLRNDQAALRAKAGEIELASNSVEAGLQELRANITLAEEFTGRVLASSEELLHRSPEVQILEELEEQERNASRAKILEARLDEITVASTWARSHVNMMQVGAIRTGTEPQALLRSLLSAWNNMTVEEDASLAALDAAFEKEWNATAARREVLLKQQAKLDETLQHEEDMKAKLVTAVAHLQYTHDELLKERSSLMQFALRLAGRPVPVKAHEIPKAPPASAPAEQAEQTEQAERAERATPAAGGDWLAWLKR